jgi:predicted transcriptional regulator
MRAIFVMFFIYLISIQSLSQTKKLRIKLEEKNYSQPFIDREKLEYIKKLQQKSRIGLTYPRRYPSSWELNETQKRIRAWEEGERQRNKRGNSK